LSAANKELERLNQLKSLFLSIAAHDLRTPLSIIRVDGDLMSYILPENVPDKLGYYLQTIQRQTVRMDWLIDDFLDLDLIEKGELQLKQTVVDLNHLVQQVREMVVYMVEQQDQSLRLDLHAGPIFLHLDTNRIQQVLYNLLNNAIKYTPPGGEICLTTAVSQDTVVLQVSDNGHGMTVEQQAQAFQLYYRSDEADTYDARGKGIGLYIVKMLIEAHSGRVTLQSQPDEGCTVTVYFPRLQSSHIVPD